MELAALIANVQGLTVIGVGIILGLGRRWNRYRFRFVGRKIFGRRRPST